MTIKARIFRWLPSVLTLILIASNALLLRENKRLSSTVDVLRATSAPPVGFSLHGVLGYDLENKPIRLDYLDGTRNSLFLVFSPHCHFCEENWPRWKQILDGSADRDVVLADVTGSVSSDYLRRTLVSVGSQRRELVIKLTPSTKALYGLQAAPLTLVVDSRGSILAVWVGVLSSADVSAVQASLAG